MSGNPAGPAALVAEEMREGDVHLQVGATLGERDKMIERGISFRHSFATEMTAPSIPCGNLTQSDRFIGETKFGGSAPSDDRSVAIGVCLSPGFDYGFEAFRIGFPPSSRPLTRQLLPFRVLKATATALPVLIVRATRLACSHIMSAPKLRHIRRPCLQRPSTSTGAYRWMECPGISPIVTVNVAHRLSDHMITAIGLRSDGGRLPTSTHAESRRIRQVRRGNALPWRSHEWAHDTAKAVTTQGGNR